MVICVYGAANEKIDPRFIAAGENLGEEIAKRRHTLVFGGGASGLMGAVARGVTRKSGKMKSIVPSFFNVDGVLYDKSDEIIYTETMRERKKILEDSSDAFVVTPGGIGTFDEFFEMLTLSHLGISKKPIAVLNTLNYFDPLIDMLQQCKEKGFLRDDTLNYFAVFENETDLLDYLEKETLN